MVVLFTFIQQSTNTFCSPWLLKPGSRTRRIGIPWELERKAESRALPQTFGIRIPGDLHTYTVSL